MAHSRNWPQFATSIDALDITLIGLPMSEITGIFVLPATVVGRPVLGLQTGLIWTGLTERIIVFLTHLSPVQNVYVAIRQSRVRHIGASADASPTG